MKILMIVGSLRKNSFNMQLAEKAAELIGGRAELSFLRYEDVPFMDQDIESPVPAVIERIRAEAAAADGIWFFTPEYNHSYPGVLKNLLDWLSRPVVPGDRSSGTAIAGKKAAISGAAGNSASAFAREKLRELLGFVGLDVMPEETGVVLGMEAFISDKLIMTDAELESLRLQADAFLNFIG